MNDVDDILNQRVTLEHCPVCDATDAKPWQVVRSWQLVKCTTCQMIYANPCPTDEALQAAYGLPAEAYSKFFQAEYIDYANILGGTPQWQLDKAEKRLSFLQEQVGKPGKLLEIGCGSGTFLKCAQKRGWEPFGIDPSAWREEDDGLNIQQCTFFEADLEPSSFDAVFMGSVLEHLLYPKRYLSRILEVLKPGGAVYIIGIPNVRSWTIRIGIDDWICNHPPGHLLYFSRQTLEQIFLATGYDRPYIRCYGMSESVMNKLFNRANDKYDGNYANDFCKPTVKGRLLRTVRTHLNTVMNWTSTGSVLEIVAKKPNA